MLGGHKEEKMLTRAHEEGRGKWSRKGTSRDLMLMLFLRAVHINRWTVHDEANLPHGGVSRSGWGRFNATAGIEEFLKTKNVTWMD